VNLVIWQSEYLGAAAKLPLGGDFYGGTEFQIIRRSFDFAKWLLEHTQRFPKSLRLF